MLRFSIIFFCIFILASCSSIGPSEIGLNRPIYNDVSRESEQEQLLKNLVRLRYSEVTYWLKMTSVTSSFSLSSSLSVNPSLSYGTNNPGSSSNVSRSLSVSPSLSYSDSPTLSFVPIESAEFATQMQTPLTMSQLLIPYGGNYGVIHDFNFIAKLVFDSIGTLSNAEAMVASKIVEIPRYKSFYEVLQIILDLRVKGELEVREFINNGISMIHVSFNTLAASKLPQAIRLKQLLFLPLDTDGFYLSDAFNPCPLPESPDVFLYNSKNYFLKDCPISKAVPVQLRSVLEILRFLSFGVHIPAVDLKKGVALELKDENGDPFNLHPIFDKLFKVYSCDKEPQENVYVKTYYRHHWFYIKSNDLDSKAAFTYLQRLMSLIAGTQANITPQSTPVLTIPVGR